MTHVLTSPWLFSAGVTGVIDMKLLSVIRRWAFRDPLLTREISRRPGLSRNTIRKYPRSDVVEPAFKVPDRLSKLDSFGYKLSAWLKVEGSRPRKQKHTVKQLHADLVTLGFEVPTGVSPPLRAREDGAAARAAGSGPGSIRLLGFPSRGAFLYNRSEDWAIIGGEWTKLQARITSFVIAARSLCPPIHYKPARCCSTPMARRFGFSAT